MLTERFWSKVNKTDTCWIWTAALVKGYGRYRINGKWVGAHRLTYQELVGPIPEGLVVDHLCCNKACVNPDHLEPVTTAENVKRGFAVNPRALCKKGLHSDTQSNTGTWNGKRYCKECKKINTHALYLRKHTVSVVNDMLEEDEE